MNKELAKTLTLALVNYIDENRTEGTMDCSSGECESIEEMFEGDQFDIIEAFIQKKLSRLTEFEKCMLDFAKARDEYEFDSTKVVELNNKVIELTKSYSKKLLALAKKELARRDEVITLNNIAPYDKGLQDGKAEAMADLERTYFYNPDKLPKWLKDDIARKELNAHTKGYDKGYKDAEKQYNESVAHHYPEPIPTGIPYQSPQCGTNVTIVPNTNSGTSTLKEEE